VEQRRRSDTANVARVTTIALLDGWAVALIGFWTIGLFALVCGVSFGYILALMLLAALAVAGYHLIQAQLEVDRTGSASTSRKLVSGAILEAIVPVAALAAKRALAVLRGAKASSQSQSSPNRRSYTAPSRRSFSRAVIHHYSYTVSGWGDSGYVDGEIDADGSRDVSGNLQLENGREVWFEGEWVAKGEIHGYDEDGNSYDLQVDGRAW
jgi:hypothetical protein